MTTPTAAVPARTHREIAAADTQAWFERELERAYLRGYADSSAGLPSNPAAIDAPDLVETVRTATRPPFAPGRAVVAVWDRGTFYRADETIRPDFPTAVRIEASRPLTDGDVHRLDHLVAYALAATLRGAKPGKPERDTDWSFLLDLDTSTSTRTHPMRALDDFEANLHAWLLHGSPARTTDKAGPGTAGTRAVEGLGDPDLALTIYYDRVRDEGPGALPSAA